MKRCGYLFDEICSFKNLLIASKKAQKGKRFKTSTGLFNLELENELIVLQGQLQNRTYRMGEYKQFYIHDPKKRLISAAPYRDRVAQHALCNVIEPLFDRTFIDDSYACRKDKGSHKAVGRYTEFSRKNQYVLKCDIKSYFASIDHELLYRLILKKIKDPHALWLIKLIIDSTSSPGIPIGNLSSQIFANLYLNKLDHYLKETVRCRHYLRYMDDLIVFDNDKSRLNYIKESIREYLKGLKLELHENKSQIYQTRRGVNFLGYKIFPTHRLVVKQNIRRLRKRMKRYLGLLQKGIIAMDKIVYSMQSWRGYALHADSCRTRRRILSEFNLEGISP